MYGVATQKPSVEKFTAVHDSNFTQLEQFNGGDLRFLKALS
jgi:hypothetical protein